MKRVVIESPLKGDVEQNKSYAKRCIRDSLARGEAPYASHIFFDQPGILDDLKLEERKLGIEAGFVWGSAAELIVFYIDRGMSSGMQAALKHWQEMQIAIEFRSLYSAQP